MRLTGDTQKKGQSGDMVQGCNFFSSYIAGP